MAMAEAHLASLYNRAGHTIIDHYTYVLAGDGDLMEGIAYEAARWQVTGLGKLIVLYDSNRISLAGSTESVFYRRHGEPSRQAGGTPSIHDGNDLAAIDLAILSAKQEKNRPSLIIVDTVIGFGSPTSRDLTRYTVLPLGMMNLAWQKRPWAGNEFRPFFGG